MGGMANIAILEIIEHQQKINNMKKDKVNIMELGKIYFIQFSSNVQLIVRYKDEDTCNYIFFDHIHYWNGAENFIHHSNMNYCVRSGIEILRPATLPEKHTLIKFELEHNCI